MKWYTGAAAAKYKNVRWLLANAASSLGGVAAVNHL